jgi:hypothetical protein
MKQMMILKMKIISGLNYFIDDLINKTKTRATQSVAYPLA